MAEKLFCIFVFIPATIFLAIFCLIVPYLVPANSPEELTDEP